MQLGLECDVSQIHGLSILESDPACWVEQAAWSTFLLVRSDASDMTILSLTTVRKLTSSMPLLIPYFHTHDIYMRSWVASGT